MTGYRHWGGVLISAALLVGGGCDNSRKSTAPVEPSADSHTRMLSLLARIAADASNSDPYFGDVSVRRAQQRLDSLPSLGAELARFRLLAMLGAHDLRLGRIADALRELHRAYNLLPQLRNQLSGKLIDSVTLALAVAYLRLGETANCVACHNPERCLLPIRGDGVHEHPRGSREARKYLLALLERNPKHRAARWLLNIASMTLGDYPQAVPPEFLIPPEAFESEASFPRFRNVAANVGLNTVSESGGSIIDDFDGDGLLDVFASTWSPSGQLRFFRNNGDGTFSDQTAAAGLTGLFGGLNILQADYDNDGDLDVLVLRGAWLGSKGRLPNSLLQNDGRAHFRDVTFDVGLGKVHYPTSSASWADYDHDGDLDLYVGNEGFPDQLFRNTGDGRFVDMADRAGIDNRAVTKGVAWGDYDGDRFPDLYVSNLDGPNRLYHNNGNGTFSDVAEKLDVQRPNNSFGAWFWDFNNDGVLDLFSASYNATIADVAAEYLNEPHESQRDGLYRGDGRGGFRDVAVETGFPAVTQPMGCNFGDIDNDGFLDIYLGTGDVPYEALMPNRMLWNRGGTRFADVTTAGGLGHLQKGHGVCFADLDHDGDLDIFIELGGAFPGDAFSNALFENPGFGNHWIKLRLVGTRSNRFGVGVQVRVDIEENRRSRSIYKWVNSGGSFGASPLRQHVGVGTAEQIKLLQIYWPTSGQTQQFRNVAVDQLLEITEGKDAYRVLPLRPIRFATKPPKKLVPTESSAARAGG